MPRCKDWEILLTGMNLDVGTLLRDTLDLHLQIIRKIGDGKYHRKEGTLIRDIVAAHTVLAKAEALSKKVQSIIEDKNGNGNGAADIEQRVMGRGGSR